MDMNRVGALLLPNTETGGQCHRMQTKMQTKARERAAAQNQFWQRKGEAAAASRYRQRDCLVEIGEQMAHKRASVCVL